MVERLTREEMEEKYPNTYLGIQNPVYENNDGITLLSAEVVYTDKSSDELFEMQVAGTGIICWYTTEDNPSVGLAGIFL